MEEFARAWEKADAPPVLARLLPDEPIQLRRLLLVELIKFDLDARLQRGWDRSLEDYAREFPELSLPADLLYEDYHLRKQAGRQVDPQDYFRRFPDRAEELGRLLGVTAGASSTSIAKSLRAIGIQAGDTIDDFDLLTQLGQGNFAKVFLARQRSMQRLVALKVSASQGAEAQTLAQLDHPHIVHVYDQRVLSELGMQLVYMAYLAGGTLQDALTYANKIPVAERSGRTLIEAIDGVLVRRGEVPPHASPLREQLAERDWPTTVCAIGARLASALDYAHRRGVLHRDVKPANVLLSADGEPLLADFNVGCCTKLEGAGPAALFGGSLAYMALEHVEAFDPAHARSADSLDGRADVFSLAVTLWELATGARPFGPEPVAVEWRDTLAALAKQRKAGPTAAAVSSFQEGKVHGLREVLLSCLEADPDRRPRTAGELARELQLCLRPATRELIRPAPGGWRGFVRRHPLLTIYPLAIIPNLFASLFNIAYNTDEIISKWPGASAVFDQIILAVNGLFFPMGMFVFWLLFRPVQCALFSSDRSSADSASEAAASRQRCLRLGAYVGWICVVCWTVAGLLWPIILRISVGPPTEAPQIYLHLLISLVFCGLIAATYPYFLVTYLSVIVLYPALLHRDEFGAADRKALHRIERELGRYRAAATAVPLLAVALLAFRGASNQLAVAVLSVAGLAGVALAFLLEGRTLNALAALADVPSEDAIGPR
jgi:serine/threonine protein kinase